VSVFVLVDHFCQPFSGRVNKGQQATRAHDSMFS